MAVNIPISKTIHPSQRQGLNTTPIYNGPEGATQTFKRGAPLVFTSGYLVEGTGPIDTGDSIVGIANADAHNTTAGAKTMGYVPALQSIIFEGILSNSSTSSHALVATDLGLVFALAKDATSLAWYVDFFNTTNPCAVIIELVDPIGTVDGRVRFVIVDDATIYGV